MQTPATDHEFSVSVAKEYGAGNRQLHISLTVGSKRRERLSGEGLTVTKDTNSIILLWLLLNGGLFQTNQFHYTAQCILVFHASYWNYEDKYNTFTVTYSLPSITRCSASGTRFAPLSIICYELLVYIDK